MTNPIKHVRRDEDIEYHGKEAERGLKQIEDKLIEMGGKIETKKIQSRKHDKIVYPDQFCLCIDSHTKELLSNLIINKMIDITETIKTSYSSSDILSLSRNFRSLYSSLSSISTTKECDDLSRKEVESIMDIKGNYEISTEQEKKFNKTTIEIMDKLEEEYSDTFKRNLR